MAALMDSGFSKTNKIGNIAIMVNFVFQNIRGFLLYLHNMLLVNVKLDVSGCKRISFLGRRSHWSSSFLKAQLKQSWQYWSFS